MIKPILLVFSFSLMLLCSMLSHGATDIQKVNMTTQDNVNLVGWYQLPASDSKKLPLVLLIHQGGSSKLEWSKQPIWETLISQGYGVLAFDLRQHGESEVDRNDLNDLYSNAKRAPLDVLAAIAFVKKDLRIDQTRIGILGASIGANLAVMAASIDKYNVKSVVALSGKVDAAQNLSGVNTPLQPRNAFLIASELEQKGMRKAWAQQWFDITKGHKKVVIAPGKKHGSYILTDTPSLNHEIIKWFKQTL